MATTSLPDITIPAATWVNLYTATGITQGKALDIYNKGSNEVDIATGASTPALGTGVPVWPGPLSNYLYVDADEIGAWAYSALGSKLSVQEG